MQSKNKTIYQNLCQREFIPLQAQFWWFEAVAEKSEDWDVLLYLKNNEVIAALPYFKKHSILGVTIVPAPISAFSYLYIKEYADKPSHFYYSLQREVIYELFKNFKSFSFFKLNFHPLNSNWLPFKWLGFSQTTRYTYILDLENEIEDIYKNFKRNVRKNIRKANRHFTIEKTDNFRVIEDLLTLLYQRQNIPLPFDLNATRKLDVELKSRGQRVIFIAKDREGNIVASVCFAFTKKRAVCLYTASDRDNRQNGVITGLYWEAIKYLKEKELETLDFDGSMLKRIEPLYASFGARQQPYHCIYKARNKFLHLLAVGLNKF